MSMISVLLGLSEFKPEFIEKNKKRCFPDRVKSAPKVTRTVKQIMNETDKRWRDVLKGKQMTRYELAEALGYKVTPGGMMNEMKKRGNIAPVAGAVNGAKNKQYFEWVGD